ncbi:MAG: hypothetical protein NTZ42_03005 [Candidatus Gribaldobacteria bacterium]|nr:hypothetical protein [Candidatus Gribaldobacteria bacterium]
MRISPKKNLKKPCLFLRPSFVDGISSVLDLSGMLDNPYARYSTAEEADFEAIGSDWKMVGEDIKNSIETYEQQIKQPA